MTIDSGGVIAGAICWKDIANLQSLSPSNTFNAGSPMAEICFLLPLYRHCHFERLCSWVLLVFSTIRRVFPTIFEVKSSPSSSPSLLHLISPLDCHSMCSLAAFHFRYISPNSNVLLFGSTRNSLRRWQSPQLCSQTRGFRTQSVGHCGFEAIISLIRRLEMIRKSLRKAEHFNPPTFSSFRANTSRKGSCNSQSSCTVAFDASFASFAVTVSNSDSRFNSKPCARTEATTLRYSASGRLPQSEANVL